MAKLVNAITGSKSKDKDSSSSSSGPAGFLATATYIDVPKGAGMGEKGGDIAQMFKKHRTGSSRTKAELVQLDKLRRVWEGVFGAGSVPAEFKTETKNTFDDGSLMGAVAKKMTGDLFTYHEGFKPDEEYFHTTNWYRGIDSANGKFRPEAKAMVTIICTFQSNKAKGEGVEFIGYPDDPENLFLEEFKTWVKDHFANFMEKDKENIRKRCGYLEDILCKEGLFDRPNSDDKFTVQKVCVDVRRVLKTVIQIIDANLTHVDAGRSMDDIMDFLRLFMDEATSLLWYSFREKNSLEGNPEVIDKAVKLHRSILSTPQLKSVLPHRSKLGGVVSGKNLYYNDNGKIEVHQDFYLEKKFFTGKELVVSKTGSNFYEVSTEEQLCKMFIGDDSGFDKNFRENSVVAQLYLESYAFLMDLGALFGVLKQAKGAAQTGGTMLLYGAANAHFNALLELTERLTDGMRTRLSKIVEIGEVRFEQLVEINWATVSRCPWIANYRELPRILVQVEKNATEVFRVVGKARSEANALTLKERKEQAEEETSNFLKAAEGLTKTAGKSMNIQYNSFKSLETSEKSAESVAQVTKQLKDRDVVEKKKEAEEAEKKQQQFLKEQEQAAAATAASSAASANRNYLLTITTSKLPGSGTDASVYCILRGTKGKTDLVALPDEDKTRFETGRVDRFEVEVQGDIGDVTDITLGLQEAKSLDADWRVKTVDILDKSGPKRYTVDCEKTVLGGPFHKTEANFKAERTKQ